MSPDAISKALATYDLDAKHRGILATIDSSPDQRAMEQQEKRLRETRSGPRPEDVDTAKIPLAPALS
jgi:hypothetical protein